MEKIDFLLEKTAKYESELKEIDYLLVAPEIVADLVESRLLSMRKTAIQKIVTNRRKLVDIIKNQQEYQDELNNTRSVVEKALLSELINELKQEQSVVALQLISDLLPDSGEDQELKIEFKPIGEDNGFVEKLIKMYTNFARINNLKVTLIDGELHISGKNAKMYFDNATCLHKLYDTKSQSVEVKVFDVSKPQKVVINPKDVRVDIFLSHGKGGQNINKVETAVRLTHNPTGIVITCQDERSQLKNKERAYARLQQALQEMENARVSAKLQTMQSDLAKMVRQNQRKFDVKDNKFTDSRVDMQIDLQQALSGHINEIVEGILLENI